MVSRCGDPRHKDYKHYGARGIVVCKRWLDFHTFVDDLYAEIGERPKGHQIDRKDNSKGYEPGNVRWATSKTNCNNRRDNLRLEHNGVTKTAAQWADEVGIPRQQIANRIRRGMSIGEALSMPYKVRSRKIAIDGVEKTVTEWAASSGRSRTTIQNRIAKGMDPKEAVFGDFNRRFDGICPRCRERPKSEKDSYCAPCRKGYMASR